MYCLDIQPRPGGVEEKKPLMQETGLEFGLDCVRKCEGPIAGSPKWIVLESARTNIVECRLRSIVNS